jgi:nucleoside-diphosphate-sugar epimerase
MRIFVAGGTGVVGSRLIRLLAAGGHHVVATTRTPARVERLQTAGAEPAIVDALDRTAVLNAVRAARPDVVVHELTSLASMKNLRRFDEDFALTNRLRTEGTRHLMHAAREAGVTRFIAQSYTGWPNQRTGGRVKTESDPLDDNPPAAMRQTLDAIRWLESAVADLTGMIGIVVRYGSLYGPGTSIAPGGEIYEAVRRRQFPIIGGGRGVWSFIHADDAAAATAIAVSRDAAGIYNIVDDDPAEVSTWLPALATAIGARPPYRVPRWLGRLAVGSAGVSLMTRVRGSSNEKAKRVLEWQPYYASWRDGFHRGLG